MSETETAPVTPRDYAPDVDDHASGPEAYRHAVALLNTAANVRKLVNDKAGELFQPEQVERARELLRSADVLTARAQVWATLAHAAAVVDVGVAAVDGRQGASIADEDAWIGATTAATS